MKRMLPVVILLLSLGAASALELVRQKNVATIIEFPIVDVNGVLVSGAAGLDTELDAWDDSTPPDGFADATNEATEVGSSGWYYLSLTQAEMNVDYLSIQVKTSTSGAVQQNLLIRTQVGDPLLVATTSDGSAMGITSGNVHAHLKAADDNVAVDPNTTDIQTAVAAALSAAGTLDEDLMSHWFTSALTTDPNANSPWWYVRRSAGGWQQQ